MHAAEVLLGFEGRVSRGLFNALMALLAVAIVAQQVLVFDLAPLVIPDGFRPMLFLFGFVFSGAVFTLMVSAIAVKRLHDLDRSGYGFLVLVLVPLAVMGVNALVGPSEPIRYACLAVIAWGCTDLMLANGTPGPNRYGADPLDGVRVD